MGDALCVTCRYAFASMACDAWHEVEGDEARPEGGSWAYRAWVAEAENAELWSVLHNTAASLHGTFRHLPADSLHFARSHYEDYEEFCAQRMALESVLADGSESVRASDDEGSAHAAPEADAHA